MLRPAWCLCGLLGWCRTHGCLPTNQPTNHPTKWPGNDSICSLLCDTVDNPALPNPSHGIFYISIKYAQQGIASTAQSALILYQQTSPNSCKRPFWLTNGNLRSNTAVGPAPPKQLQCLNLPVWLPGRMQMRCFLVSGSANYQPSRHHPPPLGLHNRRYTQWSKAALPKCRATSS